MLGKLYKTSKNNVVVNVSYFDDFYLYKYMNRNLPFKISSEEMYDLFGKYGSVRQIRVGVDRETKGTAYVVYDDIYDAKTACEHLSGFNVLGRYLIVIYYNPAKATKKTNLAVKQEEIDRLKAKYGVS